MDQYPKDIEARVTFVPPEDGGRKGSIVIGFRPTFLYDGGAWDASIHYDGYEELPKGIPVLIYFAFTNPSAHINQLIPGKEFQLWDGRVIANGVVTRVIDLENSANGKRFE